MAKDVLFEIGAEEIPAGFMPNILGQLKHIAETALAEHHLPYASIRVMGTPRRLALLIDGVEETSESIHEKHKGPSLQIAYDKDGNPTKAAIGFARGKGLDVADLTQEDGYIYAETTTEGVSGKAIMEDILPRCIKGLSFPKSMHWGDLDEKFVRPVRWLVALWGNEVIPVSFATVESSKISRGHRFLGAREIVIEEPSRYVDLLRTNCVIVDPEERLGMIKEQIEAIAKEKNADVVWSDILDEILYLVEYPTALCGTFDTSYLSLPEAAIITPMQDHQRYFPMRDKEGTLLPMFITVRNGDAHSLDVVQHGNERVLRARLDDAKFFFQEDRKRGLADRTDDLTKIVFQEGLGNLADKTVRLLTLGSTFGEVCGLEESEMVALERATVLAKTDLTTGMVTEFTELQGEMGKQYALLDGEDPEVAEAIFEQYLPRFAGDVLPQTGAGKVLSIIDKVDTIVATFSRGLIPTGSQDPYALRRQTIGILNIMMDAKWNVSLAPLMELAMELLHVPGDKRDALLEQLDQFFLLRLKNIFLDRGYPHQLIEFVLGNPYVTVVSGEGFIEALLKNRIDTNEALMQAFTRTYNLVKDISFTTINETLLKEDAEKALYDIAVASKGACEAAMEEEDYEAVVAIPETMVDAINAFFEAVMVMDKDEAIKMNRLQLLRMVYDVMATIGDVGATK